MDRCRLSGVPALAVVLMLDVAADFELQPINVPGSSSFNHHMEDYLKVFQEDQNDGVEEIIIKAKSNLQQFLIG
ncbi:unnamed protein product [Soboliphyme baturini]|uniref:Secreted protein n=1 Tax=Soboliphyme baturini TaxID=241478 RepID=A0A183IU88_9BILA|nr:unnamed protein product [Soboliphyme baturini]